MASAYLGLAGEVIIAMVTPSTSDSAVTGIVNYVSNPPAAGEPYLVMYTEEDALSTVTLEGHEVQITNVRTMRDSFSLDHQGFQFVDHQSAIADLGPIEKDEAMAQTYRAEIGELVARVTGADKVLVQPSVKKRLGEKAVEQLAELKNAKPARYVHADNSEAASDIAYQRLSERFSDIDLSAYSRFALYNVWRCISPKPQDIPLAVCDAQTVARNDPVVVTALTIDRVYGDVRHDTLGFRYNPDHRWFYLRDMDPCEVIIFKQHDSDPHRPQRVPHTAFDDPSCEGATTTRASIETRVVGLFR